MSKSGGLVKKSILIIIVSVAFYVILVILSDLEKIISGFEHVKWDYYPLIFLLSFVIYFIIAVRYHLFLRKLGIKISIKYSILVSFSGQSMFSIGRAGTLIKSYLLKKKFQCSISSTAPIIIIEQFLDLKSTIIILIISLIWFEVFEAQIVTGLAIIITILFYLVIRNKVVFSLIKKIFSKIKYLNNYVDNIDESRQSLLKLLSFKIIAVTFGLSLIIKTLQVVVVFLIFDSLGLSIDFLLSGIIYFTSILVGTFVLLPGGIIVTDSSMLSLLLSNNVDLATASTTVIITRFVTLWFMVIVGLIALKINTKIFNIKFKE